MKFALRMAAVSVVAVMMGLVLGVRSAHAATSTWTGAGGDTNMSTAGNWDVAPAGDGSDELVFPVTVTNRTVVNDFAADTSFTSITFSGAGTSGSSYFLSGARMVVTGGITVSQTGLYATYPSISANIVFTGDQTISVISSTSLQLSGILSGTGNLTKTGAGYLNLDGANTFSGNLLISQGIVDISKPSGLGSSAGGTTVSDGTYILFRFENSDKNATIAEPFTLNGVSSTTGATFEINALKPDSYYLGDTTANFTLSGAITLGANARISTEGTINITGDLSGSHTLTLPDGDYGTLVINSSSNTSQSANGTYVTSPMTTNYDANAPSTGIMLRNYQTGILTGTYSYASVYRNGVLKGTGTLGNLYVEAGGVVAPGMSPGCLTVNGPLSLYGEYQAEIGGSAACTGYDQISATGSVRVTDGTLTVSLINGYTPKQGDVFTIIDKKGDGAVVDEFAGLAEGTTFKVGEVVFKISYKGGDGNDVTLTAITVPALPKTGFAMLANIFVLKLATGLATIALVLFGAFKYGRRA